MADAYIKYVGKKPSAIDSVAKTGVIWSGTGDIKPVPEEAAQLLVKYPDQWVLVTVKEALAYEQSKPLPAVQTIEPFDDGGVTDGAKRQRKAAK